MLTWLLIAILLYYAQIFVPSTLRFLDIGMKSYVGSRDDLPPLKGTAARFDRAAENMKENFPVFAVLAAVAIAMGMGDNSQVILGAKIFILARALYVPLYVFAVPLVRSLAALGGWAGIVIMVFALLPMA